MKMTLDKFFDEIVYINLDSRPDRKEMAEKEFAKLGINPRRIPGVVPKVDFPFTNERQRRYVVGVMGCIYSHLIALRWAKDNNANILIFEDDVKFINNYEEIIPNALDELPDDWNMLYLGGNICAPITQVSEHIGKLSHAQSTHAYGVNRTFVSKLIDSIPNQVYPLDLTYTERVTPYNNNYITIPMVAVQQKSFSDIEGVEVEYESWMEDRFYQQLRRKENE